MIDSNFARRIGSKDKKKRNIQRAVGLASGLAIAGGAGYAFKRYGLKQLGKTLNKKKSSLAISSKGSKVGGIKQKLDDIRKKNSFRSSQTRQSNTYRSSSPSIQKTLSGSSQKALPADKKGGNISKQKALPPSLDPNVYNSYRKKLPGSSGSKALSSRPLLPSGFDKSPTRSSNIYRSGNLKNTQVQAVNKGRALPQRTSKTRGRPIGSKNKDKSITESTNKGKSNKGKKNKGK